MEITNTPPEYWVLCVQYMVALHNHTAYESLGFKTPMEKKAGSTPDISKFLHFDWWEPVYYLDSKERKDWADG